MRTKGNKPKGKNTTKEKKRKKKKLEVAPPGFEPVPQLPLAQKERHHKRSPLNSLILKIKNFEEFLSTIHIV